MSEVVREESSAASAKDVRVRAAEWHDRREREGWSEADQAALDAWLAQSPAHAVAFLRVDAAWSRADRLSALGHPVSEPQVEMPARRIPPIYFRAAAMFALVAALGGTAAHFLLAPNDRTFATSVGGHETVSFADGSRIELNTNTVLRARMTTEQRIVWLDRGEAFFQVKHDRLHPFIVIAGARRITDLGTQFVVRRDTGKLQVAVVQGRVWFDASEKQTASQSTLLIQGDVATATAGAMSITRKPVQALASDLSWRRGVLVFKHATLADAAAQFNRYNREKLVIANPNASQRMIGGTFPANDVEAFARVVRTALGLRVENRGDGTLVLY